MTIKILLADDHQLVRQGLRSLIEKDCGMDVVAEAENGREAVRLAREEEPDVIIMDIDMPDLNGMEATRQVVAALSGVRVIALSMHSDKRFVRGMLEAGAAGFLLKDCAFEELYTAIRTVAANKPYLSPGISGVVMQDYLGRAAPDELSAPTLLTPREREVLQLYAEGGTTREIADRLCVSIKTVETHRQRIMEKLEIRSIAELTKYAIREGLTSLKG
jgi:two-component system response regulator NreC